MKNSRPLISVILSVHNSEKYIAQCLKSLVSQSYRNIEILAIDDQSTDSSYQIIKRFNKNYKRIKAYRNIKRYGVVTTLNRLLKRARGEYIAFMDSDDMSHKDRLKNQLKFLFSNPDVVAVGTQSYFINRKGIKKGKSSFPLENNEIYRSPLHGLSMQFETVMINKNLLPKDLLRFDSNANPFIYSDFLIKLLPYGKFSNLDKTLYYHRNNPKTYLLDLQKNIFSFVKLMLRSRELHDYQNAYKLFFTSLIKPSLGD